MRSFLQLSVNDHVVVCSRMDMRTLLTLRCCSKDTLRAVTLLLRRNLEDICAQFLPKPEHFVASLARARAYLGGAAAVRFLLRDSSFPLNGLEVYVACDKMSLIYHELQLYQGASIGAIVQADDDEEGWMETHAVESMTHSWTSTGAITLYESSCDDPLAPLGCRRTSLEATYANPSHFGTAFPSLLFERRGLLADWSDGETEHVMMWGTRGFELRVSARAWPEYRGQYCAASSWVCHSQPRSFADDGALRCRLEPLSRSRLQSMVLWRLDTRPCGGRCLRADEGHGVLGRKAKFAVM